MDADQANYAEKRLTEAIIGAFYEVYNELGPGFLESVYGNALHWLLADRGMRVDRECALDVYFRSHRVGEFRADLVVERRVVVELKAASQLTRAHEVQLLNYLKASRIEVGLLLNFGPKAEVRRRVQSNPEKSALIRSDLRNLRST